MSPFSSSAKTAIGTAALRCYLGIQSTVISPILPVNRKRWIQVESQSKKRKEMVQMNCGGKDRDSKRESDMSGRERERREPKRSDLKRALGSRLGRGCCEDRSEYIKQRHTAT